MSYDIKFTDFVNKGSITVENNSPNVETSLVFPGRNLRDYGSSINENFLHLLENFANNNPPRNPVEGQLWYDNTNNVDQLKVYNGTQWVSSSGIKKSFEQPENSASAPGDLWVNTIEQKLYLFTGTTWLPVGPEFSEGILSGSKVISNLPSTVTNPGAEGETIVVDYIKNNAVIIVSETDFQPKEKINGFTRIRPGINIAEGKKIYGTVEKAESLIIPNEPGGQPVPAISFARIDRENRFDQPQRIANNGGIRIGETPTLTLNVLGTDGIISNLASGANLIFRVNRPGAVASALTIGGLPNSPTTNNGIISVGDSRFKYNLNVTGNIETSGILTINNSASAAIALKVNGNAETKNLFVDGEITIAGTIIANDIVPASASMKNIGSSLDRFNNVYATNMYATKFNGPATFANEAAESVRLKNPTKFKISGHVTSPEVSRTLGTSNDTIVFNTTLDASFFTKSDIELNIDRILLPGRTVETDKLLVERGGILYNVSPVEIARNIPFNARGPVVPVGAIMPYAGNTLPLEGGWLFCNGNILDRNVYQSLWQVIGWSFDPSLTNTPSFRLPDFRNRFPLGADITNPERNHGRYGGSETSEISLGNLPSHDHSFRGSEGSQYYAISNSAIGDDNSEEINFNVVTSGTGQPVRGLTQTSGLVNGQSTPLPLDVLNPYLAVNYIIYFGETVQ